MEEVTVPEAPSDRLLTMTDAADYLGVTRARVREAIDCGEIQGVSKGAESRGPGGGWRIPKAELDRLRAEGKLKPLRKVKIKQVTSGNSSERLSIPEAAVRFGLGRSTLEKYVHDGKLLGEKVQLGPGHRKTFVRAADVAALRAKIPVSNRGKHPKTGVPKAPKAISAIADLDKELMHAAELVLKGSYRVTKLTIALEFTGGNE